MFFTCALHATQTPGPPRWKMMIAVRGRGEASRVGPAAELDQPSSAGPSAALPGCETSMSVVYPARCENMRHLGDAALLAVRGAGWLQVDKCTPPGGYSALKAHHKLCGGLRGSRCVPREVTSKNERFVTHLMHVHLQQALGGLKTLKPLAT